MTAPCPCVATCCECSPSHRTFLVIPELRREVQYWEETKGKQGCTATPTHRCCTGLRPLLHRVLCSPSAARDVATGNLLCNG